MAELPDVSFWERGERQRIRRGLLAGMWTLIALAALSLIALSPVLLHSTGATDAIAWGEIGPIGEAYGAAATLITALSLAGIAVSLLLQVKASRTSRAQAIRTFHCELIRMQLEDPTLLAANGWPRPEMRGAEERTETRIRQHLYANQWLYFYLMQYELRTLSESNLRSLLVNELFNGEVGRQYWASTGGTFEVMKGRRVRRFFEIVEQEHRRVIASGAEPVPAGGYRGPGPLRRPALRSPAVLAAGAGVAGLAAGAAVLRRIAR